MTVPEVRRVLLAANEPPERISFRLAWSRFRRQHQACAKHGHCTRRARAQPGPSARPTIHPLTGALADLTDGRWARITALLPPPASRGRPGYDPRRLLSGMLWVMRTGATWREIPERFGPWHTIYTRYQEWRHADLWPQILAILTAPAADQQPDLSL